MKTDRQIRWFVVTAAAVLVGWSLCITVYFWFDEVLNGYLLDWFEQRFMFYQQKIGPGGVVTYYREIKWESLKRLMFVALLLLVAAWIVSVRLISVLYASYQEKTKVRQIGQMIGSYMSPRNRFGAMDAGEVFPEEYAEISVQLAEVKANMQLHEQMLKEETARKNDLITYLAHDLKTPLTSVVGYLSLLEEAPDMPAEQKAKYVHIALDKALRLEKLINEFFEITRYNLQQIVLEKETVDLEFMLVQMADEFYPILQEHGNTIRLCFAGGQAVQVYADPEKLARVFNNILKNAVAYSYPGTEITIEADISPRQQTGKDDPAEQEKVTVAFSNHGKTIPKQRLESIFEKFFRLDEARTTDSGGAGLGLAIAREIVTLHGGAVTARSEDEVTVFTVELPVQSW